MNKINQNQQSGNILFNVLLVIMFIIIAVLIYILAGGPVPEIGRTGGIQSPDISQSMDNAQNGSVSKSGEFSDGLTNPDFSELYSLDEFGAGISERDIFDRDIDGDGQRDRITRTRNENGTPHFYYKYKIELNKNGEYVDITPDGFRTTEGAECALKKLQFIFRPEFRVIKISRNWDTSWDTPTMAQRVEYSFDNGQLRPGTPRDLKVICDVRDLFN